MKKHAAFLLLALVACLPASAAITCTITTSGWSTAYNPTSPFTNVTPASFTLTCQRNAANDPTSLNWSIASNNGQQPSGGGQNRARLGATNNFILYENYRDSGCSLILKGGGGDRITGTLSGLSGFTPATQSVPYWGCVPAGQGGLAAGTYTDLPTVTLRNTAGNQTLDTGTVAVTIVTPATCNITTAPGTVAFTYAAFQAAPATGSTTFGATCTNFLPYTLALSPASGVIAGLQYSLALSATGATGSGAQQTYTISGTMPADQAGTCGSGGCAGSAVHTLTITY